MVSGEHASKALWKLLSRNGALASAWLYIIISADFVSFMADNETLVSWRFAVDKFSDHLGE